VEALLVVAWCSLLVAIGAVPCLTAAILYEKIPRVRWNEQHPSSTFGAYVSVGEHWMGEQSCDELCVWFPYWMPVSHPIMTNPYKQREPVETLCWPVLLGVRTRTRWEWRREFMPVSS